MPALSPEEEAERILVYNPGNADTHQQMNKCKTCNDYHKLFNAHEIYCD